jgi:hypothetical protein
MKKLCPNLDREDGLETVLEVPIPEEIFIHKSGTMKAWQNVKFWMKPNAESKAASMTAVFGGRNSEIQLLLGVVGAPLIPSPIINSSDNYQLITPSIKDQHIVSLIFSKKINKIISWFYKYVFLLQIYNFSLFSLDFYFKLLVPQI